MIARDEVAFWPLWHAEQSGWDFAAVVYVHLLFYSAWFVAPYLALTAVYGRGPQTSALCVPIAFWVLVTVCLFHDAIFDALDDIAFHYNSYAPVWYQWLYILWMGLTVCAVIWWRALSRDKAERRTRDAVNEVYEAWQRERALRSDQESQ
jgi:cytochrome b561